MLSQYVSKPAGVLVSGFFLCLLQVTLSCAPAFADSSLPLASRNLGLFASLYGLPVASPAELLDRNQSRLTSSLNANSTLLVQSTINDGEDLTVDAESWRLDLMYDQGLSDGWMLRMHLPLITYTGGLLDKHIDSYHQLLGLEEDSRPFFPRDELQVDYLVDGVLQLQLNERQKDLGDLSIQLAWQHVRSNDRTLSYWISLKLPTGSAESFSGSGHTDLALWFASHKQYSTYLLYGQAGILYMSDSDILSQQHRQWAGFGNIGIAFSPWSDIELKAQLDLHDELYRSELDFLGPSIQLSFGGSFYLNKQHQLDLVISEDLHAGSAPDINFNLSWYYYPD